MKTRNLLKRLATMALSATLLAASAVTAFAAPVKDATINMDAPCSLTIYKYDMTNAAKDGVWTEDSFVSTGWRESYIEDTLGDAIRKGDANNAPDNALGNGQNSNGYAIKGVEFSYLRVADIVTFTESANDQHPDYNLTQVLYGFDKVKGADLLAAIGLPDGAGRYENADATDKLDHNNYYYVSDVLNRAIADALDANSTTVKHALESYMAAQGGTAMPLTDENGKTQAQNLPVGLYLLVETKVPEMVTETTNPFFVSLPMTTVSGNDYSASPEGGHFWNYDVCLYPKNATGIPTLVKTVRESVKDTGKNNASDVITDGFAPNATGSAGDVMEYQYIASLPTITSNATSLSTWNFYDTLSKGLTYNKGDDVKIEIFTDKDCTDKVASWDKASGKFTVQYSSDDRHMTVDVTAAGLAEINGRTENINGHTYMGYSNYTMRVTYSATINSNNTTVIGQAGNENEVVLTWKRTSADFYDTLISDAHVYTFGIDLTKAFSDKDGEAADAAKLFEHVKFKIWNETDGYWVTASRNDAEGIYYVTGHVTSETDATTFYPVTSDGAFGKIIVKGLEDDKYVLTEIETANGYVLLQKPINVAISAFDDPSRPCTIYTKDVLGVLQNDPHYTFDGGLDLHLANIPQEAHVHNYMTASATVDGNAVSMRDDRGSANAEALLTVVNTHGFTPPVSGSTAMLVMVSAGAALVIFGIIFIIARKKKEENA